MIAALRKEEIESLKAEEKLARPRLSVLESAEAPADVSEACRRRSISRARFYEYNRRFQTDGVERLVCLSPVHKTPYDHSKGGASGT